MARIPLADNLGTRVAAPESMPRGDMGPNAVTQAVERLGATIQQGAQSFVDQKRREQDELDRNDAGLALLDVKLSTRSLAKDIAEQVHTGAIDRGEAEQRYDELAGKAVTERLQSVSKTRPGQQATLRAQLEQREARLDVTHAVGVVQRQQFAADAGASLDSLGKLAMLPNVPIDTTLKQADEAFPLLAQKAGIPAATASKTLQDWKDSTRFNRASLELEEVRRDRAGLEGFLKRMDQGGDLNANLDPQRVVSLKRAADSHIWQLDQAAIHAADKREKVAERAIGGTTRQIEAGVPLTAQGWDEVRRNVAGTSFEGQFNELVGHEVEVQKVMRLPLDQQEAYVQDREARLMTAGGTMTDKANLTRLRSAVETNTKLLRDSPLIAAQRLYGRETAPINLALLGSPEGIPVVTKALAQRAETLDGMRRQFGDRVEMKPLLPQEAAALVKVLDNVPPNAQADFLSTFRIATQDDETFRGVMRQIAPDSPVKARAGMLAATQAGVILQSRTFRDDLTTSARDVAVTLLQGEAILNPTKGAKTDDGRPRSTFIPDRSAFTTAFVNATGDLYRGRPGAQETDLQVAMAYYVGRAARTGGGLADPKSPDTSLVDEAITATLGSVVNVNSNGRVSAPIGMDRPTFEKKLRTAFSDELQARGMPQELASDFESYGLVNYRQDGTYVLTIGGRPVVDPRTRTPVVLDLVGSPGMPRYRRPAAEMIPR